MSQCERPLEIALMGATLDISVQALLEFRRENAEQVSRASRERIVLKDGTEIFVIPVSRLKRGLCHGSRFDQLLLTGDAETLIAGLTPDDVWTLIACMHCSCVPDLLLVQGFGQEESGLNEA